MSAITIKDSGAVRSIALSRPDELNTITARLRDELGAALIGADEDPSVKVVLLCAKGSTFSAGFALDEGVTWQEGEATSGRGHWDPVADLHMISGFARTWALLYEISKPTVAAVRGWCVAGGTDLVLNADIIVAAESARFGYPPARVWGTPEAPWGWIARLGLERAKRYLFTGDEISGPQAAELGLVLECVPDSELDQHAMGLAQRMAMLPLNQLQMMKLLFQRASDRLYGPADSRLLGCILDGFARHTSEGRAFVETALRDGPMSAVLDRDAPFGDYAARSNR